MDRVLIENGRAVGIDVIQNDARRTFRGQPIVLSAGAVHSPTILIRSGIGPAVHLEELGVDIVADLPVGEGIQDHPIIAALLPLEHDVTAPEGFRHTNSCIRYSSGREGAYAGDMMMIALNRRGNPGFQELEAYDKFVEFALHAAGDTQHGSCTCRMGQADAPTKVLCANTDLTCIMIGEKMAEVFIGRHRAG